MAARRHSPKSRSASGRWRRWWPALAVWLVVAAYWALRPDHSPTGPVAGSPGPTGGSGKDSLSPNVPPPDQVVFSSYAGTSTCTECHGKEHGGWLQSNHAMAERFPTNSLDAAAFEPPREFQFASQRTSVRSEGGAFIVTTAGRDGQVHDFPVVRVIGHDPLRQFLVDGGQGRLQTLEASYDPHRNEWFNVYGDEDRRPGEWGHWTGRGMNWNAMCASCHNTRLRKHYDEAADAYHTTMAERTVGCEACHGPMKEHELAYRTGTRPPDAAKPSREQILHACGSCHSRRSELTGEFAPGDDYFDHYHLTVPDLSDIYYADGQVRGENYVFGSFLGSRMHAAGVHCLDCHDPHTTRLILPGNLLCMRCHSGGYPKSPQINPVGHSFHAPNSPGNECVNCHMPHTTYMGRHPRRDHGFTIPDPLLTVEYGIPNACNRCHTDKDAAWALAAVEKNYGDRMNRSTRHRARVIARARSGDPAVKDELLQILTGDETPYWKSVAANLMDPWLGDAGVQQGLRGAAESTNALLRAQAAFALAPAAQGGSGAVQATLRRLLDDPVRSVRVNAAWALRSEVDAGGKAGRELEQFLRFNADQPTGQLQLGTWRMARNDPAGALAHFERAVAWDPFSAPLRHELAVLYSMMNRPADALKELQEATALAPGEAEFQYKLALACNETGDLPRAILALEKAVELDPRHARAWYNLGLAREQVGRSGPALDALFRAESVEPNDPRIPFARATIHARMGQVPEARSAAERALSLAPDYEDARRLLDSLR